MVWVRTTPRGALVRRRGKPLGRTPLRLHLQPGEGPVAIRLSLAGHVTRRHIIPARSTAAVHLPLVRQGKRPPPAGRGKTPRGRAKVLVDPFQD